ncbi:hypothetical protein H5410_001939 [Solanum commersonii]|uniref:Uncharacterized protein n=1 Tax=Solanum commersonii TaxID=4109 RepID=A0A9J6B0H0_SOLCO|nr:hypothetical protein H5410_001939 [Solanum commersonii]
MESQGTLQGCMFHLATSQIGHTHPGQPYEKRSETEVMADFHQFKRHKLNNAKEHQRGTSLLE